MSWFLVALGAYLLGSIPNGYLVGKAQGVDLRKVGSNNIGATNALRVLGKKWGYFVFAADAFKGWLAVLLAWVIGWEWPEAAKITLGVIAAIFAMIGHIFPVWLGFKGGKGISTSAGVMIALFPIWVFLFGLTVWAVLFFATRYVSVASIGAAISLPVSSGALWALGNILPASISAPLSLQCDALRTAIAAAMCVLAVWRHKSNIQRLLAGTEKKFEKK
jgi:glycerol-3-phosphate acyltransferase PlsY